MATESRRRFLQQVAGAAVLLAPPQDLYTKTYEQQVPKVDSPVSLYK